MSEVLDQTVGESAPAAMVERRIGYLLHRADLQHMQLIRQLAGDIGLTPARATALDYVRSHPGCGQTELGRALAINRASAMELVNLLEGQGAVERRSGRDRRSNALFLTAAGEVLHSRFIAVTHEVDAIITAGLSATEVASLANLISRIRTAMADYAAGTVSTTLQGGVQ